MKTENKYIKIIETPQTGKTKGFEIHNKAGEYTLAEISWYSNWRQYCLFLYDNMVFNSDCLELITNFLKDINIEHRKNWKQKIQEA